MVNVKGGSAGVRSVLFYTEHYKSKAIRKKDGQIQVNVQKRPMAAKYERIIMNIPVIRGVYLLVGGLLKVWKVYLIIFLSFFLCSYLFKLPLGDNLNTSLNENSLLYSILIYSINVKNAFIVLILGLLGAGIVIKVSFIGKYHAAEHMTDTSYEKFKRLNNDEIMKQKRIHHSCGTNFVVFFFVSFYLFSFILNNISLLIFTSYIIAYEIFRIDSLLLKPFYWIGGLFQFLLFTSQPENDQIEVAVAAYKGLIDKEIE